MLVIYLLGLLLIFLVGWFLLSQVFSPLINNKPLFPAFNRISKMEEKIEELKDQLSEEELQNKIFELERQLKAKRVIREGVAPAIDEALDKKLEENISSFNESIKK